MSIDELIMREVSRLRPEQKARVLEYTRALDGSTAKGALGTELLGKVGRISAQDAAEMLKVVDQDCERIDYDAWK